MALLTAEDVLNKAFSKTKYREGFDQDEVDDFLDEVAHTVTSLIAERDDLAARLQQANSGSPQGVEAAPLTEAGGIPGTSSLLGAATDPNPPSPAGMLAMAQKLHDEYVHAGEEEKDRIVDEAKSKAESIVEQAQHDAKTRMDDLAGERSDLERKIDDLRRFERDYRVRLKSFLENLLGDLDHGTTRAGESIAAVGADDHSGEVPTAHEIEWPVGESRDDEADADDSATEAPAQAGSEFASEPERQADVEPDRVNAPPVRESFGYQPPVQAPPSDEGHAQATFNPFAPVTQQQPIVRPGDVAGSGDQSPRNPNTF